MRVLIISDEVDLNTILVKRLKEFRFQSDIVETLEAGEDNLLIRNYDVVLMDWMLPDDDSEAIIDYIKTYKPKIVVFVLSDNDNEIEALGAGADDYIRKPFNFDDLIARLHAKLYFGGSRIIGIGDLTINIQEEKIIYKGQEIELKGKAFEVLAHLARFHGETLTINNLLDALWDEPDLVIPNVIHSAINEIRAKIDIPFNITTIEYIKRRGYRFCFE